MKHLWLLVLGLSVSCDRAGLSNELHLDAEVASREGRLPDAAAALERALRFDPADQVALERLVLLQLRMDNPAQALALATTARGLRVRSWSMRNARVVAALRSNGLAAGLAEAKALQAVGGLNQQTERELLEALVTDARRAAPSLTLSESLPEPWLAASCERLLQSSELEHAARFFLARPEPERTSAAGIAIKRLLLEHAYRDDFAVTEETLDRLTQAPKSATEHLGRLEYARRRGDDAEAARLEPSREVLSPPYVDAWKLGLARMAARRADWYGVLELTSGPTDAGARSVARRQALRCVAHLELGDRSAARAQLEAWLSQPSAAQDWSVALLLPELGEAARDLIELRRRVDKSRARRSPTR